MTCAGVGLDHAAGHAKAGRLAGAVGTQQAHDLACADFEIDAVDDAPSAVDFHQSLDFEHRHGGAVLARGGSRPRRAGNDCKPRHSRRGRIAWRGPPSQEQSARGGSLALRRKPSSLAGERGGAQRRRVRGTALLKTPTPGSPPPPHPACLRQAVPLPPGARDADTSLASLERRASGVPLRIARPAVPVVLRTPEAPRRFPTGWPGPLADNTAANVRRSSPGLCACTRGPRLSSGRPRQRADRCCASRRENGRGRRNSTGS